MPECPSIPTLAGSKSALRERKKDSLELHQVDSTEHWGTSAQTSSTIPRIVLQKHWMGPVSYNLVKNKSLKCFPTYLHCCFPRQPVDFQLLLLFLTYFSFTHQVKKPHKHKEKLANYSSKTASKCTLQRELVEKKKNLSSLASPALYVTKRDNSPFQPQSR